MLLPSISDAAAVGKFTLVEGTVDLLKGGNLPAVPAKLDLSVEEKDVIRTKSASRAEITMVDKTVLRVAQRSRIDISEYSADPSKKGVIKLDRGKIEATVDKKPVSRITVGAKANTFEIHTPNAVAGVRGTKFFVSYEKNVSITLVKDGNVCVFNHNSPEYEVCMPPSFITSVSGTHQPQQPKPATGADFNNFEKEFLGTPGANNGGTGPVISLDAPPAPDSPQNIIPEPRIDIPQTIDNRSQYPFNVTGYFANEGTPEVPDITGSGDVSVAANGTATMSASGKFVQTFINDNWEAVLSSSGTTGPFFEIDLTGTQLSGNVLAATAAGYWIDMTPSTPETGIFIGETSGTYNPATSGWQATGQGSWIDTNNYLAMTATDAGRSSLAALNIPAVEVGRVDLSGALTIENGTDYVSVVMDNVIFFAPSTGQKPGIWATNTISGAYDFSNGSSLNAATIINPEHAFALEDGNTISADFQFTQWQGGRWSGKLINGVGDLSGGGGSYTGPINFKGGAAGTMTGTTSGAITGGTAAGIVK